MLDDQFDNEKDEADEEEDWTDTTWAIPAVHDLSNPPLGQINYFKHSTTNIKQDMAVKESSSGDPSVVKRMLLNDNKAGMEGLDKQKINQIIHEASKGSRFYENERKKEEEMTRKIEEQKKKIELITEPQLKQGLEEANMLLEDFEQQRDLSRTIVHIDMDAFYAAVEMREDPSLNNKPMAVGGSSMLSTSNYHARKFGVRAAMPGFIGKKLCPNLIIVPPNFDKYTEVSKQVKSLIAEYDPNFCPMSLDEAYLDITEHLLVRKGMSDRERTYICRDNKFSDSSDHCFCDLNDVVKQCREHSIIIEGSHTVTVQEYFLVNSCEKDTVNVAENQHSRPLCPVCGRHFPPFSRVTFGISDEETIRELRTRIEQRTRLTASAGIAPNMMLSKVCSDKNKPNGQYKIPPTRDAVMNFIKDLPTRKISGIGKVSEAMLNAVGVYLCTDLYDKRALLYHLYSQISFNYFMRICLGIGSTTVERDSERKSISTERTFQEINKPEELFKKCEELTDALVEDLKEEQLKGKTVSIKIKTVKFEVKTRAHSLPNYTNDREAILHTAMDLLKTEILACSPHPLRLRLMGIRMSNLLNVSACKDVKKQGTIVGAFKKISEKSKTIESHPVTVLQSINEDIVERSNIHEAKENSNTDVFIEKTVLHNTEEVDNKTIQKKNGFISAFATSDGGHCEEINNNDTVKERFEHRIVKDSENDTNEMLKNMNDQVNMNTDCEKGEVCSVYHADEFLIENEVELDSFENRNINKDTQNSQKEVRNLETMIDNKHPNKENHGNAVLDEEMVSLPKCGPVIEQKGEQFSTTDITGSVGGDLNELTNADVKPYASKENVGGRVNRSGLIRSNKKPVRKRRNSKQIKSVMYSCPICTKEIICDSLNDFNEHVDECLEGQLSDKSQETTTTMSTEETQKGPVCLKIDQEITEVSHKVAPTESNCLSTTDKPSSESGSGCEISKEQNMIASKTNIESTAKDSESSKVLDTFNDAGRNQELEKKTFTDSEAIQLLVPSNLEDQAVNSFPSANETQGSESIPITQCDYDDSSGASDVNVINSESSLGGIKLPITKEKASLLTDDHRINNTESEASKTYASNTKKTCFEDKIIRSHEESAPPLPSIPESLENGSSLLVFDGGIDSTLHDTKNIISNKKIANELESIEANMCRNLTKECTSNGVKNDLPAADTNFAGFHSTGNRKSLEPDRNISFSSKDTFKRSNKSQAGCSWMPDRVDDDFNVDGEGNTTESMGGGHSEVGLLVCPVCNVEQRSADLNDFNSHVDSCLSKGAISEILKEQRQTNGQTFKRDRDFIKTPGSIPPAKKRKTVLPNKSPSCKTILSFFKDSQ